MSRQRVECLRCRDLYFALERECPKCGAPNEAFVSKIVHLDVAIEEGLMLALANTARAKRRDAESIVAEALEEWLDRNREMKK